MTFGEKLYQIRKSHGLSQEALVASCGMIAGCNGAYYGSIEPTLYELVVQSILTTVSGVMILLVVIYIVLKQNPYRTLRKKELVFANDVRKEIEGEFSKMKKVLIMGITICLVIFGISESVGWSLLLWNHFLYRRVLVLCGTAS